MAARTFRQRAELAGQRHVEVDRLFSALWHRRVRAGGDELRADDDVNAGRAARDFGALGLRNAARDRNRRAAAKSARFSRPMSE